MLHQEIHNNTDKSIRLDIFLKDYIKNVSRTRIQKLISNGSIKVDEYIVKPSYLLKGNEYITINEIEIEHDSSYIKKEDIPIDIIYEDQHLIVINKPSRSAKLRYAIKISNEKDFEKNFLKKFENLLEIEKLSGKL